MTTQRLTVPFLILPVALVFLLCVIMLCGFRLNPLSSLKPANLVARCARSSTSLFSQGFTRRSDRHKSFSTQTATTVPVKTMIFMDGTWMYYSLFQGRVEDSRCPIARKFGDSWQKTHQVDWSAIPQIVARNLGQQLNARRLNNISPVVDITRCNVFTSQRADTPPDSPRNKMLTDFYKNNFDVHRYVTADRQEKCVDISLAVEMLYMATVPNAYEIACIITGDKDFIPAMQKTRLMGKRVALCSMRNGCNADLVAEQAQLRDFEVIYLDEYLDEIIVPVAKQGGDGKTKELLDMFIQILSRDRNVNYNARDLGRELQTLRVDNTVALTVLKKEYLSVRSFIDHFPQLFAVHKGDTKTNFSTSLQPGYEQELQSVFEKIAASGAGSSVSGSDAEESSADIEQGKHYRDTLLYANATDSSTSSAGSSRSIITAATTGAGDVSGGVGIVRKQRAVALENIPRGEIAQIKKTLVGLVVHYLKTCTAVEANSRDLGRHLLTVPYPGYDNALVALKSASGRLTSFLLAHKRHFHVGKLVERDDGKSFPVTLVGAVSEDGECSDYGDGDSSGIDGGCYGGYSSASSVSSYGSGYTDRGRNDESVEDVEDAPVSVDTVTTVDNSTIVSATPSTTTSSDAALFKNFKVAALREELQARGLSTEGKKSELLQRLVTGSKS